jgi:biotin carboxyl carrier protein
LSDVTTGALAELHDEHSHFVAPEAISIREKVIVSPGTGRFRPLPPETFTSEGEWVETGQIVAEIDSGSTSTPVESPHRGWLMGMLGFPGQPVVRGEALFWVWSE